jgi:hypothetical protein
LFLRKESNRPLIISNKNYHLYYDINKEYKNNYKFWLDFFNLNLFYKIFSPKFYLNLIAFFILKKKSFFVRPHFNASFRPHNMLGRPWKLGTKNELLRRNRRCCIDMFIIIFFYVDQCSINTHYVISLYHASNGSW